MNFQGKMEKIMKKVCSNNLTPEGIVNGNDPFLYGEKIKAYLIRGAKPIELLKEYPNPMAMSLR